MNVTVVYNPKSGKARSKTALQRMFTRAGITPEQWLDITNTATPEALDTLKNTKRIVAVIGGDGTIAAVAQHIAGGTALLAPLPGGTLNHFTKDCGIAQNLTEAIANITHSSPTRVDYATVNDRVFLNNSSIGIYPLSLRTRKQFEDTLGKWPAAVIASIRAFLQFRLYTITLNNHTFTTPFVFVGNNTYSLDAAAKRRTLRGGHLCVYAVASNKRRTLVKLFTLALIGRLQSQPELIIAEPQRVVIHTKRSLVSVSTDGEVARISAPLTYTSHPKGLRIIGSS